MLFDFTLLPIAEVQPWGSPGSLSLHWFGLTDGHYWMEVGESRLFEYSEHARAAGASRYCDYQVVRLHEDLIDMLPYVLEPVPVALTQYLSGDTASDWREAFGAWCDSNCDVADTGRFDELVDAATMWSGARRLDSAYLSPSANIAIWSDTENVSIEWDNRDRLFEGKPAWSAIRGVHTTPRDAFIAEARSFHERLIGQMSERIEEVRSGSLAPGIKIDLPGLVAEHQKRSHALEEALNRRPQTDWHQVEASIREILRT